MKSKIKGIVRLRRKLKALPDSVALELAESMNRVSEQVLAAQRARVRVRTGQLRSALRAAKATPKNLKYRVGLVGARSKKRGWYQLFYEFGFKGGSKQVDRRKPRARPSATPGAHLRRNRVTAGGIITYRLNWKARAADYALTRALGGKRQIGRTMINGLTTKAFARAAGIAGATDG